MLAPIVFIGGRPKKIDIPKFSTYPMVVYVPKYDSKLREEFEVKQVDGKYHVYITRIGKKPVRIFLGVFDDMALVREAVLEQFDEDFNRDPKGRRHVWERTPAGRDALYSVSLHEGSKMITVTPRTVEIKKPKRIGKRGIYTKTLPLDVLRREKYRLKIQELKRQKIKALVLKAEKERQKALNKRIRDLIRRSVKQ